MEVCEYEVMNLLEGRLLIGLVPRGNELHVDRELYVAKELKDLFGGEALHRAGD